MNTKKLFHQLDQLNEDEHRHLSPAACFSTRCVRRYNEQKKGYRQNFAMDADRILHSKSYTRYIDKTQVFSLIANDHITHRVLHVQLVSRVARTIGRFLHLNEDLIEAISLGHDIGHPPFGHDGETILSKLGMENGLPPFQHNIQSVRFLDTLERKGRGWNLSIQTLDGILCHDGEIHNQQLTHTNSHSAQEFDTKLNEKRQDPQYNLHPMTLEGCVVRLSDTVSYIGRDIEDAIELNLIRREDIPEECREILGSTNGSIVYNLVTDLISNSRVCQPGEQDTGENHIGFSKAISDALLNLKKFNYQNIYLNPKIKGELPLIKQCYTDLFHHCLEHFENNDTTNGFLADFVEDLGEEYMAANPPATMVQDFMAGMTDDYFLQQAKMIGCTVPVKK